MTLLLFWETPLLMIGTSPEFALIASCFLCILLHFPSKPKMPPSISSSVDRMDFWPALKKICT